MEFQEDLKNYTGIPVSFITYTNIYLGSGVNLSSPMQDPEFIDPAFFPFINFWGNSLSWVATYNLQIHTL